MDTALRARERRARTQSDADGALFARSLVRAGRIREAVALLDDRLAAGLLDPEGAKLRCVLSRRLGELGAPRPRPARPAALLPLARSGEPRPPLPLAPGLALAGPVDAAPWEGVRLLAGTLGAGPPLTSANAPLGEAPSCLEPLALAPAPLAAPWSVAPGFEVRQLLLFNLPVAPGASSLRRPLLRACSGLLLWLPPGAGPGLAALLGVLDRDARRASGRSLAELPLLFVYAAPEDAGEHRVRADRLGLPDASWALRSAPAAALTAWAHEFARAVRAGLLRPRPEAART
ncbi:MAG: hypothetical protein D6731_19330 [Planctomycetota bacterium]|nr:MAG: hypothetical protein D6731_19330 [Planctomycetota bacterium]